MVSHLHTGKPAPAEYLELVLCRDIYHCDYLTLLAQPLDKVFAHLICHTEEQKYIADKYKK